MSLRVPKFHRIRLQKKREKIVKMDTSKLLTKEDLANLEKERRERRERERKEGICRRLKRNSPRLWAKIEREIAGMKGEKK